MIRKSLSALSEKLPVLRLYVVIGNKAENLYYNLGFLKGADIINMKLEMVDY